MLRLLHTSDWHLGHTLHGRDRRIEHAAFLDWLLEALVHAKADALLVAGDVFETANPPATAIRDLTTFLARVRRRLPALDVVIIAGNHDSAMRLDALAPMMGFADVHVVGGLPRTEDGELDLDRLLVPLRDAAGEVAAVLAAVPFLRVADLPPPAAAGEPDDADEANAIDDGEAVDGDEGRASWRADPLIRGVQRIYAEALAGAEARFGPEVAKIAAGHLYMRGTALSELSERKILGGNQHAIPRAAFADGWAYVGLGHLHLAQAVEQSQQVRYCGSPIPLSLSEADYEHRVLLPTFDGPELTVCQELPIPRLIDVLRLPEGGAKPLDQVLFELETLSLDPTVPKPRWPWLEVRVRLDRPCPDLRQQIERALRSRPVRLLKIAVEQAGEGGSFADFPVRRELDHIDPEQVFVDCYERAYGGPPARPLVAAFHELREAVAQGDAGAATLPSGQSAALPSGQPAAEGEARS